MRIVADRKLLGVFCSMRQRCSNPNRSDFCYYGGRGISVCDEWSEFPAFHEWALSSGYREGLSIDRINPDGNYEPSNCRWATKREQANNTRRNCIVTAFGESKTISLWSDDPRCNVSYIALQQRIVAGWPPEKALRRPSNRGKLTESDVLSILEERSSGLSNAKIARRRGIDESTVSRITSGQAWKHVAGRNET